MKANELKVTDLMVGDWLKHYNGTPMQVTKITTNHFACAENGGANCWEYNNKFEPIPITPEILEKNGFKMEFYSDYKVYELNNFKVCKSYCDYFEVCDLWKDSDFGWEIISFSPCIYVHQLQHALKLCGIDKEIVV